MKKEELKSSEELLSKKITIFPSDGIMTDELIRKNVLSVVDQVKLQAIKHFSDSLMEVGKAKGIALSNEFELDATMVISIKEQIIKDLE